MRDDGGYTSVPGPAHLKCAKSQERLPTRHLRTLAGFTFAILVLWTVSASAQDQAAVAPDAAPVNQDAASAASHPASESQATTVSDKDSLKVNWLYGSFVPKEVPLIPLTPDQRWKLYLRSTYTTWGIYVKTSLFTMRDQFANSPQEWGRTAGGFAKRAGTRQAQFVIQNSLSAYGNALAGWEPRYDRCRCGGFWPRTRHAIVRNFVTYGGAEQNLRPQLMPYVAAFGGGAIAATWIPGTDMVVRGYQGAITQVFVGVGVNWLAEFAPEITRTLHLKGMLN